MANYLRETMQATIENLRRSGWSLRRIARELGINRRTVRKYSEGVSPVEKPSWISSKCTDLKEVTAGEPVHEEVSKCTDLKEVTTGNGSRSLCERYGHLIEQWQEENLSAQRIYQDLKLETDYEGSYESVKRYARKLRERKELPFRRMEVDFGEEAQVDYGTGAWVVDSNGKKHKTDVLRVVLSASRKVQHAQMIPFKGRSYRLARKAESFAQVAFDKNEKSE